MADPATLPVHPDVHLVAGADGGHLFLPDGSRFYDIDAATFAELDRLRRGDGRVLAARLGELGVAPSGYVDDRVPPEPPVRALSLAVAQKCNLGCTYCYAEGGGFGGPAAAMADATARASVELLFSDVEPGDRVNLAFLGGEPMMNRPAVRAATRHARELAEERGVHVGFSITTNATLLTVADADFFEKHGFAVTVSIDGPRTVHDRLRPMRSGRGSFDRVLAGVEPLLARQRRMQVSARVTVTPENLDLPATLAQLVALGFHGVGFSPLLRAPSGSGELGDVELTAMLDAMVACGAEFERQVLAGRRYPFSNAITALREIHRGTHRPYPCGAGAGYLGVAADGQLAACHRFVGDDTGALGNVTAGVDRRRQALWLTERHVHRQEPCRDCWARYLCGGGCHHETIARGRPACDYIRGWLHWCLSAYARLSRQRPEWFAG